MLKGRKLPDWYLNEPPWDPTHEFFLLAFNDLSTCRAGGALTPIPWRDIVSYAGYHEFDEIATDLFVRVIRQMDESFLQWNSREHEQQVGVQNTNPKQRDGRLQHQSNR